MNWQDVINDKSLQDLPYKIELDKRGRIVMSPASNKRGYFQSEIGGLLREYKSGRTVTECSIETVAGIKVPDVIWASYEFLKKYGFTTPYQVAPEICVEIKSPSNTDDEINEKVSLYLSRGAKEVWVCDELGDMEFHTTEGKIDNSIIFPDFPKVINGLDFLSEMERE